MKFLSHKHKWCNVVCRLFGHKIKAYDVTEGIAFCFRCKKNIDVLSYGDAVQWLGKERIDRIMNEMVFNRKNTIYPLFKWKDRQNEINECIKNLEKINDDNDDVIQQIEEENREKALKEYEGIYGKNK